jgi:hypothetical protein
VFFDNYFTSLDLMVHLRELGIHTTGTIRQNRMKGCPLKSEKALKQAGRGSSDSCTDMNSSISIVRWLDNGIVNLASTYLSEEPKVTVKRWSRNEKRVIDIGCPRIVQEYNTFMGGVDLSDMLLSLYRIDRRSCKWYVRIIYYFLGIALNNSWLLYRKHLRQMGEEATAMSLKDFLLSVAKALAESGKIL